MVPKLTFQSNLVPKSTAKLLVPNIDCRLETIFRGKIRIEISDGLIRVTTNDDGTWINTNRPFDLKSPKIKKQELKNMFIGIKGHKTNQKGTMIVKLYKRTN